MEMSRPSDLLLQSDIEVAAASREQQRNAAQQALDQIGALLHQADDALCNLEDQDILGSAIIRGCKDIADAIGHLANHIDHQSEDERRQLAKACIDDAQNNLLLMNEAEGHCDGHVDNNTGMADSRPVVPITGNRDVSRELSALSEEEVMTAIQAAGTLLRDVEATLRAIDTDEAEEIADVALTVAHLFVASLQSLHATVTPEDLTQATSTSRCRSGGVTVEMLDEESGSGDELNQGKQMPSSWAASKPKGPKRKRIDRLRVLWPPLGPAVASACDWGKDTASQQPLLAVALGMTMWPVAVITAFVGTPLVLADGFLQDMYSNFEDTPIIEGVERSAAQLYHSARLTVLCGKLVTRQTLRVASRQVERHGGIGRIAQDIGGMAVHHVTHPVETLSMVWDGLTFGFNATREFLDQHTTREQTVCYE